MRLHDEYPPGTVAKATVGARRDVLVFALTGGGWVTPYARWDHGYSSSRVIDDAKAAVKDVRPLAVLDPDDEDQLRRFEDRRTQAFQLIHDQQGGGGVASVAINALALRWLSTQAAPKPAEPAGLGAVVEDADGNRWVRVNATHFVGDASPNNRQTYGELDVVRILSEGVPA